MNRGFVSGLLVCVGVGLGALSIDGGAAPLYVKVTGAKMGVIRGETQTPAWKDWIPGLGFRYAVSSPVGASGQATGKAQHSVVVITKGWGISSPSLFQALTTNEALPSVEMRFVRAGTAGTEEVFYTIKLTNARVVSIEQRIDPPGGAAAAEPLEDVGFVFEKIEVTAQPGNISAMDEWGPPTLGAHTNPPVIRPLVTPAKP